MSNTLTEPQPDTQANKLVPVDPLAKSPRSPQLDLRNHDALEAERRAKEERNEKHMAFMQAQSIKRINDIAYGQGRSAAADKDPNTPSTFKIKTLKDEEAESNGVSLDTESAGIDGAVVGIAPEEVQDSHPKRSLKDRLLGRNKS